MMKVYKATGFCRESLDGGGWQVFHSEGTIRTATAKPMEKDQLFFIDDYGRWWVPA